MIMLLIVSFSILRYIKSPLIFPFKTYNPLITRDNNLIQLIKKTSDEEIVKTILKNLIYVKLDIGKSKFKNKTSSQKIDFFLEMFKSEFYFNKLSQNYENEKKVINYPDLEYNNYILLKKILNLTYYNYSLCESPIKPLYAFEKLNIVNETIDLSIKNNKNEKEEKIEVSFFIPYKESIKYDHRPGVMGLSFHNYFILNIKEKVPIKLNNWIIKYTDYINEEGNLIIGGFPHEFDSSHYSEEKLRNTQIYIEKNMHPDWNLQFIKSFIILNKEKISYEYELKENTFSSLRIEEFFILGTEEYFHQIQKLFFNDYINKSICQKQTHKKSKYVQNYWHILCYFNGDQIKLKSFLNSFPIIKFYQSEMNYNFTLNATDLFTIIPDNNRILFNVEFLENNNHWVFGKPFFKKYQLIFNDDGKFISYYIENIKKDFCENHIRKKCIRYFFIIFLIIIVNLVFCYFIKKNINKNNIENKNLELSEFFDRS